MTAATITLFVLSILSALATGFFALQDARPGKRVDLDVDLQRAELRLQLAYDDEERYAKAFDLLAKVTLELYSQDEAVSLEIDQQLISLGRRQ